ncbi:uncharacterized sodium-dependent transporter HI_0736-like isoform X2 [Lineus longissimus]|uniref:uncharacterized sodium-dependent transporter HI_0736-like isoform X2 n=1 Tax=Lineus longissimus TaxID=88925 RepID=UPI00315CB595
MESSPLKTTDGTRQSRFTSSIMIVLSSLGTMVGTGNLWRFPRIVAQNSDEEGCLVFLIVWTLFLFFWTMPIISLEYSSGRFTNSAVFQTFRRLMGEKAAWCGMWVTFVCFFAAAEYAVICGWCFYYIYLTIALPLATDNYESEAMFYEFARDSYWPILVTAIALVLAAVFVSKGVSTIEKANLVLVPLFLLILVFCLIWSLTQEYADHGIIFLFTPNWASFGNPRVWVDACSQNAFDSGGGFGLIATVAAAMGREDGIVKYSTFIPLGNHMVSLIAAMTMYMTVFSSFRRTQPTITQKGIVDVLKNNGPGSSGLTFIWIPVLFSSLGVFGRVLCVLFFICLGCAGFTSLITFMEMLTLPVVQFGVPRLLAVVVTTVLVFAMGLGSAISLEFLTNQDFVWAFALVVSGILFLAMVIKYGVSKYRREAFNDYSDNDWHLPKIWEVFILVICPLEAIVLIGWWMFDTIITSEESNKPWYSFGSDSLLTTLAEWLGVLLISIILNIILYKLKPKWYMNSVQDDVYEVPILQDAQNENAYEALPAQGRSRSYQSMNSSQDNIYMKLDDASLDDGTYDVPYNPHSKTQPTHRSLETQFTGNKR